MNNKIVVIIISKYGLEFVNSYISTGYVKPRIIKDILRKSKYPYLVFNEINWVEKVSYNDAIYFEQSSKDYAYSIHLDLDTDIIYTYNC